jgi:putative spermidine/putrescine transport system ATP-binding protein
VARFVGSANVADAVLARAIGGSAQPFAIRAENVSVSNEGKPAAGGNVSVQGSVVAVQFHGAASRWQVKLDAADAIWSALVTEEDSRALQGLAVGARVRLSWPREAAVPLIAALSGS